LDRKYVTKRRNELWNNLFSATYLDNSESMKKLGYAFGLESVKTKLEENDKEGLILASCCWICWHQTRINSDCNHLVCDKCLEDDVCGFCVAFSDIKPQSVDMADMIDPAMRLILSLLLFGKKA
jgi:hypothetical protein